MIQAARATAWITRAKLLLEAKDRLVAGHQQARRLEHRSALATYSVALHPGAIRYGRDNKVLALGGPAVGAPTSVR
ncbi:hypothetical protein Prum_090830 [Phytohabitans rumicis]|uniref:Uncharacterized protein n=1 Tax=Phytohabitans rumicis TaxID=1076125 RepID=A0A6V8LKH3_9ACTN|nr:hypothetical protein Prum_090830 [Phytohabitans rumicis]